VKCDPLNYAAFWSQILPGLREVAKAHGYALTVHGSMTHDFDLVAIPWVEQASDIETLIDAMTARAGGFVPPDQNTTAGTVHHRRVEPKPHGRVAVNICYGGYATIDLSIMPRVKA
jgi:hypothetical protein